MLKIYGIKASRAIRTLWLCRELNIPFEHIQVNYADANSKTPEFLAVNPSGKIPAIDDDGFYLSESMAINFYLAKKHGGPLLPKDLRGEAKVLQWSFWVMTEVEKFVLNVMLQRMPPLPDPMAEKYFRERNPKDPALERTSLEALQKPFAYVNDHLSKQEYLLGAEFSLADLNVASVLSYAVRAKLDLTPYPHMQRWLERCLARPGARG